MKVFRILRAALAVLLIWAIQIQAHAQTVATYSGFGQMMNGIISGTPGLGGVSVSGVADGVALRTTGVVNVAATSGVRIPVMHTAEAIVTKAALAKAASRLVAGAGIIGAAYQGYEVYNWIKESGYQTCAPPDFFCKPSTGAVEGPTASAYMWRNQWNQTLYSSPNAACADMTGGGYDPAATGILGALISVNAYYCAVNKFGNATRYQMQVNRTSTCSPGSLGAPGACTLPPPQPAGPYTQEELESGLIGQGGNWDPARNKQLMDAIVKDNARQNILTQDEVVPKASVANAVADPVTTPKTVVKVETLPNADGSTSTKTTEQQTTVTPTSTGPGTVSSPPKVTYPTSTVTTVTTVNNTTSETTINTSTENTSATPDEEKSTLCKLLPDIVACAKLGDAPASEKLTTTDKTPTFSAKAFASSASCPAPIAYNMGRFGGGQSLSFEPMCNWLAGISPLFIALGSIAATWIFVAGVSKS